MRRLTIIVLTVAALYSGFWFVGANTVENGARDSIAQMQAEGWQVETSNLNTSGFPNRFDTTVTDPELTTPDGTLTWSAAFLQVFALSYRPNEVIAVFPNQQQVMYLGETLDITSDGLRASAAVRANTALALRDITISSGPLTLTSDEGLQLSAASLITALRAAADEEPLYDSYFELTEVAPPFDAATLTDGLMPDTIDRLRLDARLTTSKPLDRFAGDGLPVAVTAASLRDVSFAWGDTRLTLTGDLTLNEDAEPTGTVTLNVTNWPLLIQAATAAGAIDAQAAQSFTLLARSAANGSDDLTVPITLTDGNASLGFIPLGYIGLGQP